MVIIDYRNRGITLDRKLCESFIYHVHAPIERTYIDCALKRKANVTVRDNDDIADFSDYEIADMTESCIKEDIEAVQKRRQ